MSKSGLADSPFFMTPQKPIEPVTPPSSAPPVEKQPVQKLEEPKVKKVEQPSNRDTTTPRYHDTTVSRYHETKQPKVHGVTIDLVRKAVKEFGKEAATHRFTEAEKREIADLIYTYKNQGIRTSENEVTRIAVNFLMEDYKVNGENSVLHKILEALNE
jgi:outer membrane biosynthesis protein TonB